jgi:hypothetical protein
LSLKENVFGWCYALILQNIGMKELQRSHFDNAALEKLQELP